MYSREGAARPLEVRKEGFRAVPLKGAGPGAGGIADMPHVEFSLTDAYAAAIRRIETQSHPWRRPALRAPGDKFV
jgi:hypothetical protein